MSEGQAQIHLLFIGGSSTREQNADSVRTAFTHRTPSLAMFEIIAMQSYSSCRRTQFCERTRVMPQVQRARGANDGEDALRDVSVTTARVETQLATAAVRQPRW